MIDDERMMEKLFYFCREVEEDPSLLPIFNDFREDLGLCRVKELAVVSATMSEWMAIGPALVCEFPCLSVHITDKNPYMKATRPSWANWALPDDDEDFSNIPNAILRYLLHRVADWPTWRELNNISRGGLTQQIAIYPEGTTASILLAYLSQACRRWAIDRAKQSYLGFHLVC